MPNKPHKWGFKLYLICSLQGYAHRFEVCSGGGSKNNILPGEPDKGESGNTVVRLARLVTRNVNHIIYFDNFYTSVPLVIYLAKEGIFSLGTVRVNRLRNCKLPEKNIIMKKNVPRGFYEENVATVDDIDVSAVVWKDNKPVNLLSTYVGAEPQSHALINRRKRELLFHAPKSPRSTIQCTHGRRGLIRFIYRSLSHHNEEPQVDHALILSFPGPRSYKFMGYVQEGK